MELAAVFVLSLLGGYAFALTWRLTRYATRRHDGQHVYLRSALCGATLFVLAFLLRAALAAWFPPYVHFEHFVAKPVTAVFNGAGDDAVHVVIAAAYSLPFGPLLGAGLNAFTSESWALRQTASSLELLLHDALRSRTPVSITLENGKCYVGLVLKTWKPHHLPITVTLFPLLSGQRDELGRLQFTTDYGGVYSLLNSAQERAAVGLSDDWAQRFELTIRADKILTATLFSPKVYARFNPDWRPAPSASYLSTPPAPLESDPSGDA